MGSCLLFDLPCRMLRAHISVIYCTAISCPDLTAAALLSMFPGPSCPATGFFVCASPAPSSWGLSFSCPFFPGLIFRLSGMACRTAAGSCFPVCGGLLSFVPPSVPDAESSYFPYILHSYQSFLFHGPGRESPAVAQRRGPAITTGAKFFRGWRGYGGGRGRFYKTPLPPPPSPPSPSPPRMDRAGQSSYAA